MTTLEYTQHSVAWPTLKLHETWHADEVGVSLVAEGGGTEGECKWTFMDFDRGHRGVEMSVFGDGLKCLLSRSVRQVIRRWRALPVPDDMTPEQLIGFLRESGGLPSNYMTREK